jgi:exoribonuclease-2
VDLEARRRAVTVYLPDLRVPMVPPELTAARISLESGADRAALTAEIRVGAGGAPEAVRIYRSLVKVDRRCGYAEAAEALPAPLRPLEEMARSFRAARIAAGARVLEVPSLHLRVEGGVPVLEERAVTGLGDLAVGEAAVAFNGAAGAALREAGAAAVWRVQDPPRGVLPDRADPLFSLRARRLFAPVRFSLVPGPHAGIGAPFYLQATSPIRRYTDLLHQRQIAAILSGGAPPHDAAAVREMVDGLYRQERLVRAAEADREDYWIAAWLEARRGEVFDAVVSRPVQRGRGHAWIPRMLLERPFRWPKEGPAAPPEGASIRLRPARLSRHRGRAEFEAS